MKQIRNPLAYKHTHILAMMFAIAIALSGVAHASDTASAQKHKAKRGSFTIVEEITVGGLVLAPGDYEVKEKNTAGGPVLEFVHLFTDFNEPEGVPVYQEEVVGQVNITEQPLDSAPKRTRLQTENGKARSLEIRGDGVGYLFQSADTMAGQ